MKKVIINFFLIILLFIGIFLLLYPRISNYKLMLKQQKIIDDYNNNAKQLSKEAYKTIKEHAIEYNEALYKYSIGEKTDLDKYNYEDLLTIGESSVMGYIQIPSVDINAPIYHGVLEENLHIGVGHFEKSSVNIGGINTHTVIFGHTGLTTAKLFTDLDKVKLGEKIYIYVLGDILTYEVSEINVVLPDDVMNYIKIKEGQDLLTLITCTPYGVNSHRLLVTGNRIQTEDIKNIDENEKDVNISSQNLNEKKYLSNICFTIIKICIIIFIIIFIFIFLYLIYKKQKIKKKKKLKRSRITDYL